MFLCLYILVCPILQSYPNLHGVHTRMSYFCSHILIQMLSSDPEVHCCLMVIRWTNFDIDTTYNIYLNIPPTPPNHIQLPVFDLFRGCLIWSNIPTTSFFDLAKLQHKSNMNIINPRTLQFYILSISGSLYYIYTHIYYIIYIYIYTAHIAGITLPIQHAVRFVRSCGTLLTVRSQAIRSRKQNNLYNLLFVQ